MVGFSQNVPPKVPTEPSPSLRSPPAQKTLPLAVKNPDPGVLVVAEPVPGSVQVLAERAVDRVARLGAVEGDRGDVIRPAA